MVTRIFRHLALALLVSATLASTVAAETLRIDIFGPGQRQANIILTKPMPAEPGAIVPPMAADMQQRIRENLKYLPFLNQVAASSIIGGDALLTPKTPGIDFKRFNLSKVDLLVSSAWREAGGKAEVVFRVYEVFTGSLLFGQEYVDVKPVHMPEIADRFCSRLMEALTGHKGFFESRLAFVRKDSQGKEIWVAGPTGLNAKRVTSLGGFNTSPNWSPDGRRLIFTHVGETRHSMGVLDVTGGKTELKALPGASAISPTHLADGRIAVTLAPRGQPNIYLLNRNFKIDKALAESWNIDVSPSFDRAGRKMAFASGRMGNPHIFVTDLTSGKTTRVTYEGKYNTSPSLSPDGRLVAFSRDTPEGHRIFIHDLETGVEKQVTFGPGFDEEPVFDPDGYFIAFSSNRSGTYKLYLTTRHGDEPVMMQTGPGEAKAPDWTSGR